MIETVAIDERYCGPPGSAHGGYASALVARFIDGPAEVTLRAPPPLGEPLEVERRGEQVVLLHGDALIAEAQPATVSLDLPEHVSLEEAERAASHYPWRDRHPYPTCFGCGPRRAPGDGLRIFPGPVEDGSLFAAPWTPEPSLADGDGSVRDEFVWAALDCPSGIVTNLFGELGRILLGRLAAELQRPVTAGAPHVIQAWPLARDRRKLYTASALFSADGAPCAVARATWIEVAA